MPGANEDLVDFLLFARAELVHEDSHVPGVDPLGELRGQLFEVRPVGAVEDEVVKADDRPALACGRLLVRPDANPVHFAVESVPPGFQAETTHANDRLEVPRSHQTHTIEDAELPRDVGVPMMRPLVDECAHRVYPARRPR